MLVVREIETENAGEIVYGCFDNGQMVGRLTAQFGDDGSLKIAPIEYSQRDVQRTLLAKLERDAAANGIITIYLQCHDQAEKSRFLSAGYDETNEGSLQLIKKLIAHS